MLANQLSYNYYNYIYTHYIPEYNKSIRHIQLLLKKLLNK